MKKQYQQKREQGFTIIEVLIVLAIAALIFLIVFLAVPALQRNSRNNAIKHDAANVLSAISTFESNNNGKLPSAVTCLNGTATIGAAPDQTNEISVQGGTQCDFNGGFITTGSGNLGHLHVDTGNSCANNTAYQPNSRATAISFLVETSSTAQATQCIDS